MKFLIDAQLPRRLCGQLRQAGFEATHTLDLHSIEIVAVDESRSHGFITPGSAVLVVWLIDDPL